jgi:phytanoyl-CoA hydroxylase
MDLTTLSAKLRNDDKPGYELFKSFVAPEVGQAMLQDVISLARRAAQGESITPAVVMDETQDLQGRPEEVISKIFSLHRRAAFAEFLKLEAVKNIVVSAIGTDVDCFLSQFIFKNPGAWGQPWHQDSFYFPFTPARPIVGLWLAVTEATLDNGCLHILPRSQREPVKEHVADRREGANYGYVEIIDHDMRGSEACLLNPGDLMVFDSHLMHRSTDNISDGIRAAMVWHFAPAGTVDPGIQNRAGQWIPNPINDWVPYIRNEEIII